MPCKMGNCQLKIDSGVNVTFSCIIVRTFSQTTYGRTLSQTSDTAAGRVLTQKAD
jgi:hypothetical protein